MVNCNPPDDYGQTCEPQGTRWKDGKLYLTTRHRGILTYDPKTKELKTLVYTWRNQLFKGPNDLDFDAEGNLFFTDPWATGVGPGMNDQSGAVYQYSKDGILRRVIDNLHFPNGIAVSPDNSRLAIGDCTASRMVYALFATGPTVGVPGAKPDPLHLTFQTVRAGTYFPGAGCPDGLHYDVKGNLWIAAGGLGGVIQVDPRGIIVGLCPDTGAERRSGDHQPRVRRPGQQGDLCDGGQQRHVLALQGAQPGADRPRRHPPARTEVRARRCSHVGRVPAKRVVREEDGMSSKPPRSRPAPQSDHSRGVFARLILAREGLGTYGRQGCFSVSVKGDTHNVGRCLRG